MQRNWVFEQGSEQLDFQFESPCLSFPFTSGVYVFVPLHSSHFLACRKV